MTTQKSFLERNRNRLIGLAIVVGVVVIAGFVLVSSSQPAYACSIQLDPASPAPSGAPVTGQVEDDMGRGHETVGTSITYTYCPPASGKHYNASGQGPIAPRYYGPDDAALPNGWIHNLEHGGLVILYNCARQGCDAAGLDQLKQLATTLPNSPHCNLAPGLVSPVIARFDQMKSNYAALVWGRVLFQDKLDIPQIEEFYKNEAELNNPEQYCNPNASGSPKPTSSESMPGLNLPSASPSGS